MYEACKNFIQQNIDASNVIEYQNFAKLNYEGMLYNHCSTFILNNFMWVWILIVYGFSMFSIICYVDTVLNYY